MDLQTHADVYGEKIADVNKECMVPDHALGKNPQGKNVALRSERQTPEGKPKTRI